MNLFLIAFIFFCAKIFSAQEMEKAINHLGASNSYLFVDLNLSNKEIALIDQVNIESKEYDRFGNLELLSAELPIFLREIGNDNELVIQTVSGVIERIVKELVEASQQESAWVSVRAAKPNNLYQIPRWHTDGKYLGFEENNPKLIYKFAACLKGPATLFYKLPDEQRDIFNKNFNDRNFLNCLIPLELAESPQKNCGALFIVADDQLGAVHSEPHINEERLFFSILVGSHAEIEELYKRWHSAN